VAVIIIAQRLGKDHDKEDHQFHFKLARAGTGMERIVVTKKMRKDWKDVCTIEGGRGNV